MAHEVSPLDSEHPSAETKRYLCLHSSQHGEEGQGDQFNSTNMSLPLAYYVPF